MPHTDAGLPARRHIAVALSGAKALSRLPLPMDSVWGYSFVLTLAILKVLDVVMGLSASEEEERLGLDVSQHGERGYVFFEEASPFVPAQAPASAPRPAPQSVPQQASSEAS